MILALRQLLGRLHADQDAVTLTEFVITLPIFIILFAGMLKFNKVADAAIDHKVLASKNLWTNVYSAEDEMSRMTPRSQLVEATRASDIWSALNLTYRGLKGHWGESYMAAQYMMQPTTGVDIPRSDPEWRILDRRLTDNPEDIIGSATVTRMMVDDTLDFGDLKTMLSRGARLNGGTDPTRLIFQAIIGGALQILGATSGYAANIRYGSAEGSASRTTTVYGRRMHFNQSYNALISPATEPPFNDFMNDTETRAWMTARLVGELENPYGELMDFLSQDLDRNVRYRVPKYDR
jgi:hypothetical protein